MVYPVHCTEDRLPGTEEGCRVGVGLGLGFGASLLVHHQKPPVPSNATRITPTIATLIAQRIASFAIRKKITRITTPAMMKIVVLLII
jgi:hypothetical protein